MTIYGYVSGSESDKERQREKLRPMVGVLIQNKDVLFEMCEEKDIVKIYDIAVFGSSVYDVVEMIQTLCLAKKCQVHSLDGYYFDNNPETEMFVTSIKLAKRFQHEVNSSYMKRRLVDVRSSGKALGRPRSGQVEYLINNIDTAKQMLARNCTYKDVAKEFGVSTVTLSRVLKQYSWVA